MKFRTGFVSNSSSSSFVIGEIVDPLLSLARQAVWEYEKKISIPVSLNEVTKELLKKSGRKKTLKEFTHMSKSTKFDYVAFESINYPTEIFYMKPFTHNGDFTIFISTCNNESSYWEEAINAIRIKHNVRVEHDGDDGFYEKIYQRFGDLKKNLFQNSGAGLGTRIDFNELKKLGYNVLVFEDYEEGFANQEE